MAIAVRPSRIHVIPAPVRDDHALGPTEDLDREPDGVPHDVVGLTFLFSVLLALLCAAIFVTGGMGRIAALLLAVISIPALVTKLSNRAARERDDKHPAR
jgi:uncharacterized membrane protein YphA (DoxX/SURF4 family)